MSVVVVLVTAAALILIAAAFLRSLTRARRLEQRDREVAQRRVAELAQLRAPDELPKAPELPKSVARRHRARAHPIARKRDGDRRY